MQARTIKKLASLASIAALDMKAGSMTLGSTERGILGWYYGIYFAGGVLVDGIEVFNHVPLSAETLRSVANLFDDNAEVRILPKASSLELQTGKVPVTIQHGPAPVSSLAETFTPISSAIPSMTMKREELESELAVLRGIATKNAATPILSATKIVAINNTCGFQAANGSSMVYQSTRTCVTHTPDKFEVVVPVEELSACLSIFDEEDVGLAIQGRSLLLIGARTWAKLQTMAGEWPKLSALAKNSYDEPVKLPTTAVKTLVAGAHAFKAPAHAIIRPDAEGIGLETERTELGQYQDIVDGSVSRTYNISVEDLDVALKMTANDLTLNFCAEKNMSLVQEGNRRLYIAARAL